MVQPVMCESRFGFESVFKVFELELDSDSDSNSDSDLKNMSLDSYMPI